jgi:hypothetical protein
MTETPQADEPPVDLFAGIPVTDFAAALAWYERFFGGAPDMFPHATEAVWGVGEHSYVYIVQQPERAGRALVTLFVGNFDERLQQIADQGLTPVLREQYENGVRKITYRDADGNEISLGGLPASAAGA